MDIIKIFPLIIAAVVLAQVLKQHAPEFSTAFSIGVSAVLLLYILYEISPFVQSITRLFTTAVTADFSIIVKTVGIGLITEIVCSICEDAGQKALATKAVIAGKFAILIVALPLFEQMLSIITELLK